MGNALIAPKCTHCENGEVKLRRQVIASGAYQIAWYCLACKRWAENPPVWMKHAKVTEALQHHRAAIEDIPVVEDYSGNAPCRICKEPGEYHHWAPQVLAEEFGDDWASWPSDPLCVKHHNLWHQIVTPYLCKQKRNEDHAKVPQATHSDN